MSEVPDFKRMKRIEGRRHGRFLNFSCFQNRAFLKSERAKAWLIASVQLAMDKHEVDLWAYVIMPTHVHLMVFPRRVETLMSRFVSTLKQSVSKRALAWVEKNTPFFLPQMADVAPNGEITHRFWQRGPGFDRNLWSPKAIRNGIKYIHMNPVVDKLCKHPHEWPWSSAGWYRDRTPGPLPVTIPWLEGY